MEVSKAVQIESQYIDLGEIWKQLGMEITQELSFSVWLQMLQPDRDNTITVYEQRLKEQLEVKKSRVADVWGCW